MSANPVPIVQSNPQLSSEPVKIRIEIGGVSLTPAELAEINDGLIIALDQSIDEPVEIYAGERLVARGQIIVIDDEYCIQLDEVFARGPGLAIRQ